MVLDVLGVIGVVALSAAIFLHKGPIFDFKVTIQHKYPDVPAQVLEVAKPVDYKQKPTPEETAFYDKLETGFRAINEMLHGEQEKVKQDEPR